MKLLVILALVITVHSRASDTAKLLYNPYANVQKDITEAVTKAKTENKHVLIQIGANWCVQCYRFNAMLHTDSVLKKIIKENYVLYHLNYSEQKQTLDHLKKMGVPLPISFPTFVILDNNGNTIYTEKAEFFKKGNGYDYEKIAAFLNQWSPKQVRESLQKE